MTTSQAANEEQAALWNGPAGQAWVETQESLDRLLEPFERELVEIAALASAAACWMIGARA